MAQKTINLGTADQGNGDPIRTAFSKVNDNFTELYTALGLVADNNINVGAFEFTGSTISTTDSSAIVIDQATTITSNLTVGGDVLPQTALGGDLGSSAKPWKSLYVSNNTIFIGGTALGINQSGELTVNGSSVADNATPSWNNVTDKPTIPTDISQLTDTGNLIGSSNPFDQDLNTDDSANFVNLGLAGTAGAGYATLSITTDRDFYIGLNDTTTGSKVFEFGRDGGLTIPGDIKSESAINININLSDSTLRRWTFGEDGVLNLPGSTANIAAQAGVLELFADVDSNNGVSITSGQSDIINTGSVRIISDTDGNEYTWTFGSDGSLTVPGNSTIKGQDNTDLYELGGSLIFEGGLGGVQGQPGNILIGTNSGSHRTSGIQIGSDDERNTVQLNGNVVFLPNATVDFQNVPVSNLSNIGSEGNINIDINLSDSTLRRWTFGEDGELNLPNDVSLTGELPFSGDGIPTSRLKIGLKDSGGNDRALYFGNDYIASSGTEFIIKTNDGLGVFFDETTDIIKLGALGTWPFKFKVDDATPDGHPASVELATQGGFGPGDRPSIFLTADSKTWQFDGDTGDLTIPGDIRSEGNINIDINLSDSTLHRWTFGEDGVLNLPGALKNVRIDDDSITLGRNAGLGGNYTVAIGYLAGNLSQGQSSVAIGDAAGTDQGARSVAVGRNAGNTDQGDDSVAIGNNAGTNVQATLSVAVGSQAGQYTQGQQATAVGSGAGNLTQSNGAVAVGANAGAFTQGQRAVAVGSLAGADNQGEYAVALGNYAGAANQPAHSIVINATGQPFSGSAAGFFVDPIRNIDGDAFLNYNASTKEIGYSNDIRRETDFNIDINLSDSTLRRWTFGEDGDLTFPSGAALSNQNYGYDVTTLKGPAGGYIVMQATQENNTGGGSVQLNNSGTVRIVSYLDNAHAGAWEFDTDGVLSFPDGAKYEGQTVTMPTTPNGITNSFVWEFSDNVIGSDTITLNWNLLASDTAGFYFGTTHSTNGKYLFLDGNEQCLSYFVSEPGNGRLIFGATAGNNAGDVNAIELKAGGGDVYLTSTESVKITVDAADSSARVWTFDPAGELTFPDATTQTTAFTLSPTLNVLKIEDGVHEKFQELADATGTVTHDCSSGHIFYHASPDANWTVNLTNLNLSVGYATTVTIIIDQGGTGYYPNALQIGGAAQTINWQGNATPTPSTNRQDVVSFSILAFSGGYTVLGQLTGF